MKLIKKIKKCFLYRKYFTTHPDISAIVWGYVREKVNANCCKPMPMASVKMELRYGFNSQDAVSVIIGYIEELENEITELKNK